jgi:hypothetical protein
MHVTEFLPISGGENFSSPYFMQLFGYKYYIDIET